MTLDRHPPLGPAVSIVMTAYNHERFIRQAIESCLAQSWEDFELIIVNDGSTDGTAALIGAYRDPRITVIDQANAGPSAAFNAGVAAARGEYVAWMSGDDVCLPQRLERQLALGRAHPGSVVFSHVQFIDAAGEVLPDPDWARVVFNVSAVSRHEVMRRFLETGNFLAAPSAFMARQLLLDAGPLHPALFQLQDFEYWTRLIRRADFRVIDEPLIQYRMHDASLSRPSAGTDSATRAELQLVYRAFVDGLSREDLDQLFPAPPPDDDVAPDLVLKLDKAMFLRQFEQPYFTIRSNELLFETMESPEGRALALRRHGYSPQVFWMDLRSETAAAPFAGLHGENARLLAENQELSRRLGRMTLRAAEGALAFFDATPWLKRPLWLAYGPLKKALGWGRRIQKFTGRYGARFILPYSAAKLPGGRFPSLERTLLEAAHRHYAFHPLANARLAQLYYESGERAASLQLYQRAFLGDPFVFIDHAIWLRQFADLLHRLARPGERQFVHRRLMAIGAKPDHLKEAGLEGGAAAPSACQATMSASPRVFRRVMGVSSLESWLRDHPGNLFQFSEGTPFEFGLPRVYGEEPSLERFVVESPPSSMATVHDVVVGPGFSVIAPQENQLIVYEPASHPKFGQVSGLRGLVTALPGNANAVRVAWGIEGTWRLPEAVMLSGRCSANYYHWLIEYLPRLKEIEAHGTRSPILVSGQMPFQHYETLSLMLGEDHPLVFMPPSFMAEVETLHIPSFSTYVPDDFESPFWMAAGTSKVHLDYLRARILPQVQAAAAGRPHPKKIFLSRARNVGRGMTNERQIVAACRRAGFTVIYPELMSFREQVACFNHADVIMGPTGAAFANVIFCRPGTSVFGLTSERNKTFCNFANLAMVAGVDFTNVTGPNDRPPSAFASPEEFAHSSFTVPMDKIDAILASR